MFTIGQAVSISENDQVKPTGKHYMSVNQVWLAFVCVAKMLE